MRTFIRSYSRKQFLEKSEHLRRCLERAAIEATDAWESENRVVQALPEIEA